MTLLLSSKLPWFYFHPFPYQTLSHNQKTLLLLLVQIVCPFTLRQVSLRREIWFSSSSARFQLKAVDIHSLVEATKQASPLHGCCPHHHKSGPFNLLMKHFALIQYTTVSFMTFLCRNSIEQLTQFPTVPLDLPWATPVCLWTSLGCNQSKNSEEGGRKGDMFKCVEIWLIWSLWFIILHTDLHWLFPLPGLTRPQRHRSLHCRGQALPPLSHLHLPEYNDGGLTDQITFTTSV